MAELLLVQSKGLLVNSLTICREHDHVVNVHPNVIYTCLDSRQCVTDEVSERTLNSDSDPTFMRNISKSVKGLFLVKGYRKKA